MLKLLSVKCSNPPRILIFGHSSKQGVVTFLCLEKIFQRIALNTPIFREIAFFSLVLCSETSRECSLKLLIRYLGSVLTVIAGLTL